MNVAQGKITIRSQGTTWHHSYLPNGILIDADEGNLSEKAAMTFWRLTLWGRKNGEVFVQRGRLAKHLKMNKRVLQRHIEALVALGWIDRQWAHPHGAFKEGRYVLILRETRRVGRHVDGWVHTGCPPGCAATPKPLTKVVSKPLAKPLAKGTSAKNGTGAKSGTPSEGGGGVLQSTPQGCTPEYTQSSKTLSSTFSEKKDASVASRPHARLVLPGSGTREAASEFSGKEDVHAVSNAPRQEVAKYTVPPDDDDPEVLAEKKAAEAEAAKKPKGHWPPKSGMDVWRRWLSEVKLRYPKWRLPPNEKIVWGKEGALGKKLMLRFKPDDLVAVMRVAIWDWPSIRGDQKFYDKKAIPELTEIVRFAEQLAGRAETGWTDHKYRVSAYATKFVKKLAPESVIDMSAVAAAARGRRKA